MCLQAFQKLEEAAKNQWGFGGGGFLAAFTVPGGSWLLICMSEVQCSLVRCVDFASMEDGAATPVGNTIYDTGLGW